MSTPTSMTGAATALADVREQRSPRIGGIVDPLDRGAVTPAAVAGMRAALGQDAQLLLAAGAVADTDACFLHGMPLRDLSPARQRLHEIDGAFAAAWHDPDGTVVLASDPIGQRRIYYSRLANGVLVFASTLHGVLGSGLVPRRLARRAVPVFLAFAYLPTEQTLVENVYALPPGHSLRFDPRQAAVDVQPYWRLPGTPCGFPSDADLCKRLRAELQGAVARALPQDVNAPVGCTLSGGIDSSLVVALARQLHRGPITTYSIAFGPEHRNELPWSDLVAKHCGVARIVVEASPRDVVNELDATVGALSQPNGDPLTVPNALLFRRAACDTRFMLNGEGGDPCFGGPKNAPMLLAELLDAADQDRWARARNYLRAHQKCYDDLPDMLQPELAAELGKQELEQLVDTWLCEPRWPGLLDKLMAINVAFKGAHHILPKVDHLSFASGICPRSPLFDRRVVELSFGIPARLKRHGAVEKHLLKQAVHDLLPQSILMRPKSGMMVPVEAWFQGALRGFATERLLDGLAAWDLFDPRWLRALLDARLGGLRPRRGVKIWLLLTLEAWLRKVLRDA
jgi:asparagine synthase (glutamine-hydrolysing)